MGLIIDPYKFVYGPVPTFQDNYTTNSGWTQTGTTITVDSGIADQVAAVSASGASTDRVSKSLGVTLSNSLWYADFDYYATTLTANGDDPQQSVFALASSGDDPRSGTQDNIMAFIYKSGGGTIYLTPYFRDGSTTTTGTGIILSIATQYYVRLERTSTTNVKLSIFSDSGRTSHISGSPTNSTAPATVTGLTTIIHGSNGAGGSIMSWNIDNTKIYNNVSP